MFQSTVGLPRRLTPSTANRSRADCPSVKEGLHKGCHRLRRPSIAFPPYRGRFQTTKEFLMKSLLIRERALTIAELNKRFRQVWSGKRDSNPQPSAWKADALAVELFPHISVVPDSVLSPTAKAVFTSATPRQEQLSKDVVEGGGFEPPKSYDDRFTVCSLWPLGNPSVPCRKNLCDSFQLVLELAMGLEPATC